MSKKTSSTNTKKRLGRGLSSLIKSPSSRCDSPPEERTPQGQYQSRPVDGKAPIPLPAGGAPREIAIDQIAHNPHQPRRDFDEARLSELAQSIRQEGILQPLIVTPARPDSAGGVPDKPFVLIAGERRLRAAAQAGLSRVPCVLREATERQMLEWAVIENIQRLDLNPVERAQAYRDYMDRFNLTQDLVAKRMGQPRATVANYLRILDLCDEVRSLVASGRLSFGHAKILAGLTGSPARQVKLARKIVAEDLSVRKLEALLAEATPKAEKKSSRPAPAKPAYVRDAEQRLTEAVGTRVTILPGRAKDTGRVVVEYYSLDDFDRVAKALGLEMRD